MSSSPIDSTPDSLSVPTSKRAAEPKGETKGETEGDNDSDNNGEFDVAAELLAGTTEHYRDAQLYEHEYKRRRADVAWYRKRAREIGGPILELGCGAGRLFVPLAEDGHELCGIDLSQSMLDEARRRLEKSNIGRAKPGGRPKIDPARVELIRGSFLDLEQTLARGAGAGRRKQFPLVICPFNAFQHLYTVEDARRFLAGVSKVLAPGGHFIFDVLNPDVQWLARDPVKRWARTRFVHPVTKRKTIYTTNQTYDAVNQIAWMRIYYEDVESGRETVVKLAHRQFFPVELQDLVSTSGFRITARWGGFHFPDRADVREGGRRRQGHRDDASVVSAEIFSSDSESQVLDCVAAK